MGNQTKKTQKAQQKKLANAMFGKQKGKKKSKTNGSKNRGSPTKSVPGVMSSVSDGLNTGMVWKNSNQVRDHFNRRFEKVADLISPGAAFTILQSLFLNPGNSVLFPVFSQIASTYEEYICHLLRFWYRGESYTAISAVAGAGIVAYATNMDPDDPGFTNVSQMENYEGSVSGPPFAGHFMHDVQEVHKAKGRNRSGGAQMALNQYFVYSSANQAAPANSTAKFYDLGLFQVACNGLAVVATQAVPIGELWVEHEWTLIRRKQETPIGQQALYAHIVEGPAATAAAATPLGTSGGVLRAGSTIPCVSTTTAISMPVAGTFLCVFQATGSVSAGIIVTNGSNITGSLLMNDSANSNRQAFSGGTSVYAAVHVVSQPGTGAANLMTISGVTSLAAGTFDCFISQISGGATFMSRPSLNQITSAFDALCERFDKLERKLVTGSDSLQKCIVSEPDTPFEEEKGTELESSVHISKSTAEQLLRGLGLRK